MNIRNLTVDQIKQVYSGKNGKCCCGCSGTHYTYGPMLQKVLNKMVANAGTSEGHLGMCGEYVFSLVVGARLYVIYVKPEAVKGGRS